MKKLLLLTLTALFLFTACGGEPVDLQGDWQAEGMTATITADTVTVYWSNDGTKALYWAGSYDNSNATFTSVNDKEQTDVALMASGADDKVFTVDGSTWNIEVTMMGVTNTVEFEKVS